MPKQTPKRSKKTTTKKTVKKLPKNTPKIDPKNGETVGGAELPETAPKPEKNGNKSQYANKVKPYLADIARYIRCGLTEGQLCEYYNVGKTQWAQYKKKYPELNETLFKARQQFKTDLVSRAYEVAMGYEYEETSTVTYRDANGNVTSTKTTVNKRTARADGNMIQFLLINRFCGEFARDPQAIELRKKALELAERGVIPPDSEGSI